MQPTPPSPPDLFWAGPFLGVLASIALIPMVAPRFWHRNMGWVAGFWIACLLLPEATAFGGRAAAEEAWHAILIEYLPFVTLLLALYVAGGGILIRGGLSGTPTGNTVLLGIGTLLAGIMGTTGASMVLIHPLLRANAHRRRKIHLAVFFIVLVSNAGGALSPLGDPPLYLGYLRNVPFFWPLLHLGPPLALIGGASLAVFFMLDWWLARDDPAAPAPERLRIRGLWNALLIGAIALMVLFQGSVPGTVNSFGQSIAVGRLCAIVVFLAATLVSLAITPRSVHQANDFAWPPIIEVVLLFLAIFVTIGPVLRMLEAGSAGPFAPILAAAMSNQDRKLPAAFFWLTGSLSAFLDNAPTYLVFYGLAGIRPEAMGSSQTELLRALSAGAVFFGALTYIGNAPNMMVRAIAAHRGVRMPGFFGFSALAAVLLLPLFVVLTAVFFS